MMDFSGSWSSTMCLEKGMYFWDQLWTTMFLSLVLFIVSYSQGPKELYLNKYYLTLFKLIMHQVLLLTEACFIFPSATHSECS